MVPAQVMDACAPTVNHGFEKGAELAANELSHKSSDVCYV